jgi:hypothetical protein
MSGLRMTSASEANTTQIAAAKPSRNCIGSLHASLNAVKNSSTALRDYGADCSIINDSYAVTKLQHRVWQQIYMRN